MYAATHRSTWSPETQGPGSTSRSCPAAASCKRCSRWTARSSPRRPSHNRSCCSRRCTCLLHRRGWCPLCARVCVCVCVCVFVVNAQQKTTHKIVGARVYCKHARTLSSTSKVKYTHVHTHTHTRMRLEDPCLPRSHDARCAPPCEAVARTHSIILLFVLSSLSRPFVPLH